MKLVTKAPDPVIEKPKYVLPNQLKNADVVTLTIERQDVETKIMRNNRIAKEILDKNKSLGKYRAALQDTIDKKILARQSKHY